MAPPNAKRFSGKRRPPSQLGADALPLQVQQDPSFRGFSIFGPKLPRTTISSPDCVGILDMASKSVWVVNSRDIRILWERGFFGKGSLSRSEPSWLKRRINELSGPKNAQGFTAEEVTAKRRLEREKFKSDRAEAILRAQAEAEANFQAGIMPNLSSTSASGSTTPAVTGALATTTLVALPVSPRDIEESALGPNITRTNPTVSISIKPGSAPPQKAKTLQPSSPPEESEATVDMEHLQLTLSEAFFLSWALGCLRILDPITDTYLDVPKLMSKCLEAHLPFCPAELAKRPDNPFLIHYAVYHYYRSLGWVVRGGIKFCVDYLLYKKGPAFHHAEFALVVCPVYEDSEDEASSPFQLKHTRPMDWAWFSTMNRVNSQVKKTLILVYVTIPSLQRTAYTPISFDGPECVSQYTVREVVVRRFIPARMRD